MHRVFLVALVLTSVGLGAPRQRAAGPVPAQISAPVVYKDLMIVVVTKDGAAAVTFANPAEDGTAVEYSFRFESADGTKKVSDTGKLFERRLPQGGYDPDGLSIAAGPVSVTWSKGGRANGWIYYAPESVAVHLANARDFKTLDLRRFMKK